jgi:hypothetical protein
MNYSRHQLYALGEPIGESATHKSGGRIVYGSGGGGGPTSSTVTQSNVPDWLRPQVETTLGAATQELFNVGKDGKVGGLKSFTPYSQNPSDYVAGFSPMQNQAFGNIANLQVPGQFGTGTQMAQMSGQGALSVAPQAAGIASQQANAGNQYMGMATDPGSMQAFMSPYMQNVVNVQQQQAQRQADIANQASKAGFAQRGAFGGSAQGLAQAQANADLMRTKQGIQATGLQNAFQNAQQAQQFGSNLGLQGLQGAQQGMQNVLGAYDLLGRQGANVGNLGTQQLAAQKDIIGLQSTAGGQQQQQQQNIINQAIQNFANERQYPIQQLNAYNALIRGYAAPGQTTTSYQAAPPMASQIAGLGMGAYGVSQMMGAGKAEGGIIRGMAKGGKVQSMATGGLPSLNRKVLLDPESVTLDQVQQGVKNETISDLIGIPVALQKQNMSQQAAAMQQQQPKQTLAEEAMAPAGITSLQSNLPVEMARGGIIAFSGETGSLVESDERSPVSGDTASLVELLQGNIGDSPGQPEMYSALARAYPGYIKNILDFKPSGLTAAQQTQYYQDYINRAKAAGGGSPYEAYRRQIEGLGSRDTSAEKGAAFLQAGAAMMQPGMNFAQGLTQAGSVLGQKYAQINREDTAAKRAQAAMNFNLLDAERKERMGLHRDATSALAQASKDQRAVDAAELSKRRLVADLVRSGIVSARPTGTGRGAQIKLPEMLAAAELEYEENPNEVNLKRVTAMRRAVAQARTSDIGPGREGVGVLPSGVRATEEILNNTRRVMSGMDVGHPLFTKIRDARLKSKSQDPTEAAQGQKDLEVLETQVRKGFEASYPPQAIPGARPAAGAAPKPPTTRPASPTPEDTQRAVNMLLSGKGTDAQFDEIFGAGAAAKVRAEAKANTPSAK